MAYLPLAGENVDVGFGVTLTIHTITALICVICCILGAAGAVCMKVKWSDEDIKRQNEAGWAEVYRLREVNRLWEEKKKQSKEEQGHSPISAMASGIHNQSPPSLGGDSLPVSVSEVEEEQQPQSEMKSAKRPSQMANFADATLKEQPGSSPK